METPLISLTTLGEVDHTQVKAPYFRLTERIDNVCVYDMRMLQPNTDAFRTSVMHSLEHCLAVAIKRLIPNYFVNCAPLGCRTGYYITTVNFDPAQMGVVLKEAITDILEYNETPLANIFQCGNCEDHNILGAKMALEDYIEKCNTWSEVL